MLMLYLYKNLSILKKLTEIEISKKIKKIPNWTYQNKAIQTSYKFNDFKDTFFVMKQIAFMARMWGFVPFNHVVGKPCFLEFNYTSLP